MTQPAKQLLLVSNFFKIDKPLQTEGELKSGRLQRDLVWSQNVAVGHKDYVENIKTALGITGRFKSVVEENDSYALREPVVPYTAPLECEKDILSTGNTIFLE
jgi:hypothetical protein